MTVKDPIRHGLAEIPVPHSLPGFLEALGQELHLPAEQALRWLAPRGPRGPDCSTTKPGRSLAALPIP